MAVNVTQKLPCTRYSPSPMQSNLTASMVLLPIVTFESSELLLSPNWIEDECQNRLVLIRFVADHSVSYTHRLPRRGAGGGTQGGPQTGHPQNLGLCSKGQNAWVFLLVPQRGLLSGFPFFCHISFLWNSHNFLCHTLSKSLSIRILYLVTCRVSTQSDSDLFCVCVWEGELKCHRGGFVLIAGQSGANYKGINRDCVRQWADFKRKTSKQH